METATLTSIHWHDERFAFDSKARNPKVEQACFHHFFGKNEMTIVDLGAGTGSNCLYFFEKFPGKQNWIFIEKEERISKYALKRLTREASTKGYLAHQEHDKLVLKKEEREIKIEYVTGSFLDLVNLVNLDKVDLVMASAVFDLISFPQFVASGSVLLEKKLPLLTTLNYAEMNFDSDDPSDPFFIEKYESYMNRPQAFGKAMGKKCPRILVNFFQKQQAKLEFGSSIWKLEGKPAKGMNNHLLNFIEAATQEMLEEEEENVLFEEWIKNKRAMTTSGTLNTYVQYYDLFVSGS
ncbi:MAG: class I SAM-dependent methyltransferase [Bacteroidota bacterium]